MLTTENTNGYTKKQLTKLNAEFEKRFAAGEWNNRTAMDDNQKIAAEKIFSDEISHR